MRIRPQLIEAASATAQAIFVAAGLVTVGSFIASYFHPTTRLVADIYPMESRMPVNGGDLGRAWTKLSPNQPMDPVIAHVFAVTGANGFARIDLRNEGNLPIEGIHIRAAGIGATYAKGTPNMGDTVVLPSDDKGITIEKLEQDSAVTIYIWSGIIWGSYSHWNGLDDQFQITYSQGVAEKRFHIPVGTTAEFIDKHIGIFYTVFGVLFTLSVAGLAFRLFRGRQSGNVSALQQPKLFEVHHVVPAYTVANEKEYFDVTVTLRFLRPIKGASFLLHIYGVGQRTIELIKNENYPEGAERRLIVARIPYKDATEGAVWGSPGYTENPPLVAGSENVAVIDLQTFEPPPGRQKFRIYIKMMQIGSGTSGRFFLTDERQNLFDLNQFQHFKDVRE